MSDSSQPQPDQAKPGSPDVPSSKDPKDINAGLAESPEYTKLEILQNKVLALHDSMKLNQEAAAKLSPDMVEELEHHRQIHLKHVAEIEKVSKEIVDHNKAIGNTGPARQGSSKTLHFPALDKLIDLLMKLLQGLLNLMRKGATMFRNMLPNGKESTANKDSASNDSAKPGSKEGKTVIGLTLPGGGVAINAPKVDNPSQVSTEQAESAAQKALDASAERQNEIKATLEAEAENANDTDGPAPGSSSKKPK